MRELCRSLVAYRMDLLLALFMLTLPTLLCSPGADFWDSLQAVGEESSNPGVCYFHRSGSSPSTFILILMITVKDTLRATVRVSFDGRVLKQFHGPKAEERFHNEVRILRHLEEKNCTFVPRLIKIDPSSLTMVTTNCGTRVDHLDAERCRELFAQLEIFGVVHEDPDIRNVTYRQQDGRFCLIDFEFASLVEEVPATPDHGHR